MPRENLRYMRIKQATECWLAKHPELVHEARRGHFYADLYDEVRMRMSYAIDEERLTALVKIDPLTMTFMRQRNTQRQAVTVARSGTLSDMLSEL